MFPTFRHRILILVTALIGALVWLLARPVLVAADGGSGYSLLSAQAGPVLATLVVLLLGLPVLALGLMVSSVGHPLSGMFVVAVALCVLAGAGGPIDGWLFRQADANALPAAYTGLIAETLIWQVGVIIMLTVIGKLRSPLRARYPALAYNDHLGVDIEIRLPQTQAIVAGIITAAISGFIALHLIRSSDTGQIMCSLILAFMIGGCIAHLSFPHSNPVGILLSPAMVAIAAYLWMLFSPAYTTTNDVLQLAYNLQYRSPLPAGLAMALPIHYASAALTGVTLGIGMAQSFDIRTTTDTAESSA